MNDVPARESLPGGFTPQLSVCCVTYNHEKFVAQTIGSVLGQRTDFPFEIIVGDDASTDATRDILRQIDAAHPGRLQLILRERNLGAANNFVDAYSNCRGKYVAVLDGDDYWTAPDKLQKQVTFLEAHPDYSLCFHPVAEVNSAGRPASGPPIHLPPDQADFGLADLFRRNFIPTCSVVFRRGLFGELPGWYSSLHMGDWPMHMLNARYGRVRMLPEKMAAYRIHSGGVWSGRAQSHRLEQAIAVLTTVRSYFGSEYEAAVDRGLAANRFDLAWLLAGEGAQDEARKEFRALLESPVACRALPRFALPALRLRLRFPRLVGALQLIRQRFDSRRAQRQAADRFPTQRIAEIPPTRRPGRPGR